MNLFTKQKQSQISKMSLCLLKRKYQQSSMRDETKENESQLAAEPMKECSHHNKSGPEWVDMGDKIPQPLFPPANKAH